jgi:PP-loop superfamily ATP-utilizing enzyme
MKSYLSFGGGVNSVALYLLLVEQGVEFEAVFVHHGSDHPSTYAYVDEFAKHHPLTILKPFVEGHSSLYFYCYAKRIIPSMMFRWCTDKFKAQVMNKYYKKPCFNMMGIDAGESHRARLGNVKGIENRFPLIEAGLDRQGCVELIKRHGLSVPPKSGCFICPFQSVYDWKQLRANDPDLFCKAEQLERRCNEYRDEAGKPHIYLNSRGPLREVVEERQSKLWVKDEYPPCNCGL